MMFSVIVRVHVLFHGDYSVNVLFDEGGRAFQYEISKEKLEGR